jgi:diguanylate cyclase (GGDEF)-like protein/PAS domain S-box-containing protein
LIHKHHSTDGTDENALSNATPHQKAMQALVEIMSQDQNIDYKQSIRFALSLASAYLEMPVGVTCQIDGENYVIETYYLDEAAMLPEYVVEERLINSVNNSPYAMLMASTSVVAVDEFSNHPETKTFLGQYQMYAAFIGTQLSLNEQCVGGLIFFDQASRLQPFTSIEKEFVQMLGQWMQKMMHQNQLDEQLSMSNERITLALSGGNLGLWDVDLTNKNVVLNDRWSQMLGYKQKELTHRLSVWKRLIHPEDLQAAYAAFKSLVKGEADEVDHVFKMQHKDGHWVWVHNRGKVVARDFHGMPTRMMGTHMDVSALRNAEEEVKQLAFYDVLTALPNRRLLLDRLKLALVQSGRNKTHGALIFIDLDDFKTLNETLGHEQGDVLLKNVAERLSKCLRDGDTVARFGGDEFVVMLDNLEAKSEVATTQVEKVGDKIIESLNQPYQLNGIEHHSSPTLGATLFNGTTDKIEDTLQKADIAMYQAKNAGKNCLRFFDQSIQSNLINKTKLAEDLRVAIEAEQFVLFYQPQVNRNGEISGAEALVRWIHPTRGMVSPLDFIPLAEETGLITDLGSWVMEAGCKQLVEWEKDPKTASQDLSVNVSARQFQQPDFVNQVVATIHKTGANPKKLKLELTESMLVDDVDDVISKMSQLRVYGVRFSLDDFGTGVSSLRYLKLFPLTQLKIDKSFVDDILTDTNDAVIARTIVALANSLGLNVIAEGVEIEGQRDFLAQNGCHDYQGYLFSRPLKIEDYNTLCSEYDPPELTDDDALKNMMLL